MVVAVFARKVAQHELVFFQRFFEALDALNWDTIIERHFYAQLQKNIQLRAGFGTFSSHLDLTADVDLVISIGGDGTFLKAVSYVRDSGIPILGINTGRLGFLADSKTIDFEKTLQRLDKKDFHFQPRSLLTVETEGNVFGDENFAFNEVAIHRKDTASMITVEAFLGDRYLNSYWADGLLVGTPTGSTAYNLSCGGPIISPGSNVHFLTPISAHNLNVRPIIVPDDYPIILKGKGRDKEILISLDSQTKSVANGTKITIKKAAFSINLIKFNESDFFKTIREKMMWGIDQRNE